MYSEVQILNVSYLVFKGQALVLALLLALATLAILVPTLRANTLNIGIRIGV